MTKHEDCFLETAISAMMHYGVTADQMVDCDDGHDSFFTSQLKSRAIVADTVLELLQRLRSTEEVIANMTPPSN